jgi:hypothetical protein
VSLGVFSFSGAPKTRQKLPAVAFVTVDFHNIHPYSRALLRRWRQIGRLGTASGYRGGAWWFGLLDRLHHVTVGAYTLSYPLTLIQQQLAVSGFRRDNGASDALLVRLGLESLIMLTRSSVGLGSSWVGCSLPVGQVTPLPSGFPEVPMKGRNQKHGWTPKTCLQFL